MLYVVRSSLRYRQDSGGLFVMMFHCTRDQGGKASLSSVFTQTSARVSKKLLLFCYSIIYASIAANKFSSQNALFSWYIIVFLIAHCIVVNIHSGKKPINKPSTNVNIVYMQSRRVLIAVFILQPKIGMGWDILLVLVSPLLKSLLKCPPPSFQGQD